MGTFIENQNINIDTRKANPLIEYLLYLIRKNPSLYIQSYLLKYYVQPAISDLVCRLKKTGDNLFLISSAQLFLPKTINPIGEEDMYARVETILTADQPMRMRPVSPLLVLYNILKTPEVICKDILQSYLFDWFQKKRTPHYLIPAIDFNINIEKDVTTGFLTITAHIPINDQYPIRIDLHILTQNHPENLSSTEHSLDFTKSLQEFFEKKVREMSKELFSFVAQLSPSSDIFMSKDSLQDSSLENPTAQNMRISPHTWDPVRLGDPLFNIMTAPSLPTKISKMLEITIEKQNIFPDLSPNSPFVVDQAKKAFKDSHHHSSWFRFSCGEPKGFTSNAPPYQRLFEQHPIFIYSYSDEKYICQRKTIGENSITFGMSWKGNLEFSQQEIEKARTLIPIISKQCHKQGTSFNVRLEKETLYDALWPGWHYKHNQDNRLLSNALHSLRNISYVFERKGKSSFSTYGQFIYNLTCVDNNFLVCINPCWIWLGKIFASGTDPYDETGKSITFNLSLPLTKERKSQMRQSRYALASQRMIAIANSLGWSKQRISLAIEVLSRITKEKGPPMQTKQCVTYQFPGRSGDFWGCNGPKGYGHKVYTVMKFGNYPSSADKQKKRRTYKLFIKDLREILDILEGFTEPSLDQPPSYDKTIQIFVKKDVEETLRNFLKKNNWLDTPGSTSEAVKLQEQDQQQHWYLHGPSIKERRTLKRISQMKLSMQLEVDRSFISQIEQGKRPVPEKLGFQIKAILSD